MKKQFRGSDLKELRKKHNLTLVGISELLDINYHTYLNWEYDQTPINDLMWSGIVHRVEEQL